MQRREERTKTSKKKRGKRQQMKCHSTTSQHHRLSGSHERFKEKEKSKKRMSLLCCFDVQLLHFEQQRYSSPHRTNGKIKKDYSVPWCSFSEQLRDLLRVPRVNNATVRLVGGGDEFVLRGPVVVDKPDVSDDLLLATTGTLRQLLEGLR